MPRTLSLHSFTAALRAERRVVVALVSAGRFDRSAIMREAVKLARSIRKEFGSWQVRMGIALRTVWGRAKAAMVEACAAEPFPVREPALGRPARPAFRSAFRSRSFTLGSRATTHGW